MTAEHVQPGPPKVDEPTIGKLVTDVSRDVSTLIQKEIQLAKAELSISVKAGGIGIVFFLVAAFLGLMTLILLSVTIAYFIHWNGRGLALHWAFLIVTGFYLLTAGLLALLGLRKVKQVKAPQRSIDQAQQTAKVLKRS